MAIVSAIIPSEEGNEKDFKELKEELKILRVDEELGNNTSVSDDSDSTK